MSNDLVAVKSFDSLAEAEAGKIRLEAGGLTVVLADGSGRTPAVAD